jgi:hypothetical protein
MEPWVNNEAGNIENVRRLLNGDLDPDDEQKVLRTLAVSAELRTELDRHRHLWDLLLDSAEHFDDYFSVRVLNKIRTRLHSDQWINDLLGAFRKVALVATILTGLLVSHNVVSQWEARRNLSTVEITLAIPPATIQSSLEHLDFGL